MISDQNIRTQLVHVLQSTDFNFLGNKYEGKVRDCYSRSGTDRMHLITTDRLSCFDRVVTAIPFKGQILTQLAIEWFKRSQHIIDNHIIELPDPNVMFVKQTKILPIEVVVRAYLTGSAWRDYQAGKTISGVTLPQGMRPAQKLPQVILTPSTKAPKGDHDLPISESEIVSSGIVSAKLWQQVKETAMALFNLGQEQVAKQGLILVDTKYEFGLYQGNLILADEIHTLDSSRYWVADTYQERFEKEQSQQMLDKEPVRQWLLEQGFKGDGPIPKFSDDYRVEIAKHYISSYERILGKVFEAEVGSVQDRILQSLRSLE